MSTRAPSFKLSDIENLDFHPVNDDLDLDLELDEKQRKYLSPETHEILAREKVRRAIRDYGTDGLSIEEIVELTGLERTTITKHLNKLIGLREVYSQKKNKKLTLYYHNGRPLHQLGVKKLDFENPILEICIAQGPKDNLFFYILEKRFTILDGEVPEGAVMVPFNRLNEFITALQELRESFGGES